MRKLRDDEIEARWLEYGAGSRHPVIVLLEDVRSAYNVGAIFRTSDAAALSRIIVSGITATPENRRVHKTALGAQETIDWEYVPDAVEALHEVRSRGYRVAALEITDRPTSIGTLGESDFPLCVVVGNEVTGISDRVLGLCDLALELPQYGTKHSLNAAVAFGIAAFAIVDRYRSVAGSPTGISSAHPPELRH